MAAPSQSGRLMRVVSCEPSGNSRSASSTVNSSWSRQNSGEIFWTRNSSDGTPADRTLGGESDRNCPGSAVYSSPAATQTFASCRDTSVIRNPRATRKNAPWNRKVPRAAQRRDSPTTLSRLRSTTPNPLRRRTPTAAFMSISGPARQLHLGVVSCHLGVRAMSRRRIGKRCQRQTPVLTRSSA